MFIPYAICLYVYILNKILTQEEIKGPIKRCICLILSHDLPYLPCHVLNLWTVGILHVLQALPWCSSLGSVGVHLPLKSARGMGGIHLQLCSHPICCHSWNLLRGQFSTLHWAQTPLWLSPPHCVRAVEDPGSAAASSGTDRTRRLWCPTTATGSTCTNIFLWNG